MRPLSVIAAAAVTLLFLASVAFWHLCIEPQLLISKTRFGHMLWLSWAVYEFDSKYGRLPTSLEELVKAGLLPVKGPIYFSPMKHHTLRVKTLDYQDCEFGIEFQTNSVVLTIPAEVASHPRYRALRPDKRTIVIQRGEVVVVDPVRSRSSNNDRSRGELCGVIGKQACPEQTCPK